VDPKNLDAHSTALSETSAMIGFIQTECPRTSELFDIDLALANIQIFLTKERRNTIRYTELIEQIRKDSVSSASSGRSGTGMGYGTTYGTGYGTRVAPTPKGLADLHQLATDHLDSRWRDAIRAAAAIPKASSKASGVAPLLDFTTGSEEATAARDQAKLALQGAREAVVAKRASSGGG
jgi:hypothetical protein